jgi:hypothetical protein
MLAPGRARPGRAGGWRQALPHLSSIGLARDVVIVARWVMRLICRCIARASLHRLAASSPIAPRIAGVRIRFLTPTPCPSYLRVPRVTIRPRVTNKRSRPDLPPDAGRLICLRSASSACAKGRSCGGERDGRRTPLARLIRPARIRCAADVVRRARDEAGDGASPRPTKAFPLETTRTINIIWAHATVVRSTSIDSMHGFTFHPSNSPSHRSHHRRGAPPTLKSSR